MKEKCTAFFLFLELFKIHTSDNDFYKLSHSHKLETNGRDNNLHDLSASKSKLFFGSTTIGDVLIQILTNLTMEQNREQSSTK